jgi:cell division protein FtsZ
MGKAMMGTGEASGDNRAIEAAEKAIANPLLDGVSMKGAKGVIVSITGGEDMRLMEVDEAANHIRELVDPDANIIWGSAFNNDLEGKIRVSVVATGIESEVGSQAEPAKVFSFPAAKPRAEAAPAPAPASVTTPAPAPAPTAAQPVTPEAVAPVEASMAEDDSDELLLGSDAVLQPPIMPSAHAEGTVDASPDAGRRWINQGDAGAEPAPARTSRGAASPAQSGGTLFERMSSIARGAAKAQVEEEQPAQRRGGDNLDLPGFLNRQNNQ